MASQKGSSAAHSKLVNEILIALGRRSDVRVWKNATGGVRVEDGYIRFGLKGSADILGITSDGKTLAIECKTGLSKQSKYQRAFMNMILRMNGRYIIARDVDTVVGEINGLRLPEVMQWTT